MELPLCCSARRCSRTAWPRRRSCAACGARPSCTGCRRRSLPPWRASGRRWRESATHCAPPWTPRAVHSARFVRGQGTSAQGQHRGTAATQVGDEVQLKVFSNYWVGMEEKHTRAHTHAHAEQTQFLYENINPLGWSVHCVH